jgi:pyrroloquinoline quinone biosynthesis protein B
MQVMLLGTAAGGGFPQWNCWCPTCRVVRADPTAAVPRSQSSAAVTADGHRWFLLNASPDVRHQIERIPATVPAKATMRQVPIEGVVLTDAELDHTLGVTLLREARCLRLYATDGVRETLDRDSVVLPVTRAFAEVDVRPLPLDGGVELMDRHGAPAGLRVEAFTVPAGPPRFASAEREGHTVGLTITAGDRSLAFVPGCGELDDALLGRLGRADLLLFDGTFWTDDELVRLRIGPRTARQMDHLPVSGPDGSLTRLAALPCRQKVYTHINNTNPMLLERGPERDAVERAGLAVGADGMTFTL